MFAILSFGNFLLASSKRHDSSEQHAMPQLVRNLECLCSKQAEAHILSFTQSKRKPDAERIHVG